MIIDIILAALLFYLMFPALTGYAAYNYGRSFLVWFIIGCFLPIISYLLLVGLIFWDERKTAQVRLTKAEKANADRLVKKLLQVTGNSPSSGVNSGIK